MASSDINRKVVRYEEFLNEKLRTDLTAVLDARQTVFTETAEYLQLKHVVEKMCNGDITEKNMKTMVDIGSNFYMKAVVPDASFIIVSVGLNFYVQFSLQEALDFIDKKMKHLDLKGSNLTKKAADISARIKIVMQGLKELQLSSSFNDPEQKVNTHP